MSWFLKFHCYKYWCDRDLKMVTLSFFQSPLSSDSDHYDLSEWKAFSVAFEAHTVVLLIRNVHIFCCLCNPALLQERCMYWLSEEMFHHLGFEITSSKFSVFLFSNLNSFAISWLYVYHKTLARFQNLTCGWSTVTNIFRSICCLLFELTHGVAVSGESCGSQVAVHPACGHHHIPVSRFTSSMNDQAVIVILQCPPLLISLHLVFILGRLWFCCQMCTIE